MIEVSPASKPVWVIDHHDSFVHTLVGYLHELGAATQIAEADEITREQIPDIVAGAAGIMLAPGPGAPADVPTSAALADAAIAARVPVLGVCLGHQVLAHLWGAEVCTAPELFHGVTSEVRHTGHPLFDGISSPFTATRYHSLAVDAVTLPSDVQVVAATASGVVMAISHQHAPAWGVQFHPESVLTDGGYRMLANWLTLTGLHEAVPRADTLSPHIAHLESETLRPSPSST